MTIAGTANSTNVPAGSFGALRPASSIFGGSLHGRLPADSPIPLSSTVLAWTMLPIGFAGGAASLLLGGKRRNQQKKSSMFFVLWTLPLLVFIASLAGCATPSNYRLYTVTITAMDTTSATPLSQTTTVQLVLAK